MRNPKILFVAGLVSFALLGGVELGTSQSRPAAAATFTGAGGGSFGAAVPQGNVGGAFTSDPAGSASGTGISIGRGGSVAPPAFGSSTGTGSSSAGVRPPTQPPSHCGCNSSFTMPVAPTMPNLSSFGRTW